MKAKKILFYFITVLILNSCSPITIMTSSKMNKLELGMSKKEVISILGTEYINAEKRIENNIEIEILSYRDFYRYDEFYMFLFANNKLEKWYRELLPKYEKPNQ